MSKKVKVFIWLIWFVLSIVAAIISALLYPEIIVLSILSMGLSFAHLVSDPEIVYMDLW